jgi:hypothetical protein
MRSLPTNDAGTVQQIVCGRLPGREQSRLSGASVPGIPFPPFADDKIYKASDPSIITSPSRTTGERSLCLYQPFSMSR